MRRTAVALALAMLAAGAVRAATIEVDFNPKAEFERYKTWAWGPDRDQKRYGFLADATGKERVEKFLAGCLQERGLRPAGQGESPDLLVSYQGDTGQGKTVTATENGTYYGVPSYMTLQITEQGATIIVDLVDASKSALAWRMYVNEKLKTSTDTPAKFWQAFAKGMEKYPPSESARAKKAKQIEKQSR
jgi:hypothetical protein